MLFIDIHHVSLNVVDLDRSLAFYVDVLGMKLIPRPELAVDGVWLDAGNGDQVHLIVGDVPGDLGQHLAFRVDDVDRAIADLRAVGIDVPDAIAVGPTGIRQTFLLDPDENRLELTQPA